MNAATKTSLRRELSERRDRLVVTDRRRWASAIVDHLLEHPTARSASCVASYSALRSELDMTGLHDRLGNAGIDVALPRVRGHEIEFVRLTDATGFARSPMGIDEPQGTPIDTDSIDLVVVPGIAFDRQGYRLGYGGGYYDRLLARLSATTIGPCPAAMLVDSLPIEPHDCPVDVVITEHGVVTNSHSD